MLKRTKGFVVAFALGAGIVTIATFAFSVYRHTYKTQAGVLATPAGQPPILGATRVSLATAKAQTPFPLMLPADQNANVSNLTQIWWSSADQEVALVFGPKIEVFEEPSTITDPQSAFQDFLDQNLSKASIQTIQGQPALVIEPGTDYPGTNPAFVRVVLNGVNLAIQSDVLTSAQLVNVAESMSPVSASG